MTHFDFRFDWPHRVASAPFGVIPATTGIDITTGSDGGAAGGALRVRFGLWVIETPLANIESTCVTGPYHWIKTAGPARLSMVDRGLTFATNSQRGVCLLFREPIRGLDPGGRILHPGLTVTPADIDGFRAACTS